MLATSSSMSRRRLLAAAGLRYAAALVLLPALFFLPAGTWDFWEAWVYMAVLLVPMTIALVYLLIRDPGLMERRIEMKEKEKAQGVIVKLSGLAFFGAFILPGFDRRYGWSDVPAGVVLAADALILLGYVVFFLVLRENTYAARTIRVEEGQEVISTGPYAIVRHPMYVGVLLMCLFTPLALGSWWAVIPAFALVPLIAARILDEERLLLIELEGYKEYTEKTRYRLVPGLW